MVPILPISPDYSTTSLFQVNIRRRSGYRCSQVHFSEHATGLLHHAPVIKDMAAGGNVFCRMSMQDKRWMRRLQLHNPFVQRVMCYPRNMELKSLLHFYKLPSNTL